MPGFRAKISKFQSHQRFETEKQLRFHQLFGVDMSGLQESQGVFSEDPKRL